MTDPATIERLAREAGFTVEVGAIFAEADDGPTHVRVSGQLARFAALIAAHERERCAKVCEAQYNGNDWIDGITVANKCAAAIRAL